MAAPAFIQEAETAYDFITPVDTPSFNALAGDVLVAWAFGADAVDVVAISNNGAALTWAQQQQFASAGFCWGAIWTTELAADRTGLIVSFTRSGAFDAFAGNVLTFRGSAGVGASTQNHAVTSAPTANIVMQGSNSVIVVACADWQAASGASRAWRANAGALSEVSYFNNTSWFTVYGGYHADSGPATTYAVGLTTPTQDFNLLAVEIKGSAADATTKPAKPGMFDPHITSRGWF